MPKHILIIDDQDSLRELVRQTLEDQGYIVDVASDGTEGLNVYESNPAGYDMILSDVNMPGIDGFELLKRVKEKHPAAHVVFLTGVDEEVCEVVKEEYKADAILRKPFLPQDIIQTVKNLLEIPGD